MRKTRKTIKMLLEELVASLEKYLEWWKTRYNEVSELNGKLSELNGKLSELNADLTKKLDTEKALVDTLQRKSEQPLPLLLWCPSCGMRHVDRAGLAPHRTHACQGCGMLWRPANVHTVGVAFLDGTKDGGTT